MQGSRGVSEPKPKDLITYFENTKSKNDCMVAKVNGILIIICHIRENFHSLFHLSLYFNYVYYHHTIGKRNVEIRSTTTSASQVIKYPIISDDCLIVSGAHSATSSSDTGDFGGGGEGVIKW
jgi:hypothetical protein